MSRDLLNSFNGKRAVFADFSKSNRGDYLGATGENGETTEEQPVVVPEKKSTFITKIGDVVKETKFGITSAEATKEQKKKAWMILGIAALTVYVAYKYKWYQKAKGAISGMSK